MKAKSKRKAIRQPKEEMGDLPLATAHLAVSTLLDEVKDSEGITKRQVWECVGKTEQTFYRVLAGDQSPLTLLDILECLGHDAEIIIRTKPKKPVDK